jgi:hypothetical protein
LVHETGNAIGVAPGLPFKEIREIPVLKVIYENDPIPLQESRQVLR